MKAVPLDQHETAKQIRWKQWLVLHPRKQPAILCLHARVKARLKAWKPQPDPDAEFVAAVVGTVR